METHPFIYSLAIENLDNWSPRMKQPFIDMYGEDYFHNMWAGWIQVMQEIFNKRNGKIFSPYFGSVCIGTLRLIFRKYASC